MSAIVEPHTDPLPEPKKIGVAVSLPASVHHALVALALTQKGFRIQKRPSVCDMAALLAMGWATRHENTDGTAYLLLTPAGWFLADHIPM